jgi:hypothetical protein
VGYWPESMTVQKATMRLNLPGAFQGGYLQPRIDRASLESVRSAIPVTVHFTYIRRCDEVEPTLHHGNDPGGCLLNALSP